MPRLVALACLLLLALSAHGRDGPSPAATQAAEAGASAVPAPLLVGPYKHVPIGIDAAAPRIATPAWLPAPEPGRVLIWAFATGACAHERWGDFDSEAFARLNVAAALADGRDYIVSTGGAVGSFSCDDEAAMERFVARYQSPRLRGIDFDIEGAQTPAQIGALVRAAQRVHARWPQLRLSFTLATHAASDGSRRSLNATGEAVLAALAAVGLDEAVINLMVMNYGQPDRRWCVPRRGRCDMGRSAAQALRNAHEKYGLPYRRLAMTLMLGENDVKANVSTPADAAAMARELGLAGLHWWSLDRDRSCAPGSPRLSPHCHGLPGLAPGRFEAILDAAVR